MSTTTRDRVAVQWDVKSPDPERCQVMAKELALSPLLAQVLINRGLSEIDPARRFLNPDLLDLAEPSEYYDLERTAERICQAIQDREPILVYGDYDVDGVTASTILLLLFRHLKAQATSYIPDRASEGYGLNQAAMRQIAAQGTKLIVTVDSGIRAAEPIRLAHELGMTVVVTDHHLPGAELPPAYSIVDPHRPECQSSFKSVCGASLAFKLAWAIARRVSGARKVRSDLREFLIDAMTFAAVGTVADVLPLIGENRTLVHHGLRRLAHSGNPGLTALLTYSRLDTTGPPTARDIGYGLGPRINAAGRLGHARQALDLFLTEDPKRAEELAQELDQTNKKRQQIERQMIQEIQESVESAGEFPSIIALASDQWHPGVIGIVAGRLSDRWHRPVLLISITDSIGRGSARSIPGFDICAAIERCSAGLESYGGHSGAAGMVIQKDRIEAFFEALRADVNERLRPEQLITTLAVDAVCSLEEIHRPLVTELERLMPFGMANPPPVFATQNLQIAGVPRRVGQQGQHLSFFVRQGRAALRAIAFGRGDLCPELAEASHIDLAYEPFRNRYRGNESVELTVKDIVIKHGT